MTTFKLNHLVMGIVLLTALAVATSADARWGRGAGDCPGYGGKNCPGYDQLSEAERNQADDLKDRFLEETKDIRDQLREKGTALGEELSKDTPDTETAAKIQTDISQLRAQLDQVRLTYQIEMKKINPDLGRGRGHQMWYGDRGGYGRGPCRR